jgi:NADH-quinone oxidoreductase subunit H
MGEVGKFAALCLFWISLVFIVVFGGCWTFAELPQLIASAVNAGPNAQPLIETLRALTPIVAVAAFIPTNATFMVLCERRALALFTVRKGPNRVGPDGWFQTAADAIKLLLKEDITPTGADPVMFTLAPIVFFAPSIFGAMPLLAAVTFNHPAFATMNISAGIFFVLAMSSIPVVALVMGGWASNNKYSLVGGLRSAAQAIAYEIPLVLSLVTICVMNGTLNVVDIAVKQSVSAPQQAQAYKELQSLPQVLAWAPPGMQNAPASADQPAVPVAIAPPSPGVFQWNLFGNGVLTNLWNQAKTDPSSLFSAKGVGTTLGSLALVVCTFLLMGIYMTGACAEINRIPFDLPEAESELVSGYNTEYSGIKFAIFFLAEFTNLFIVSTVATVMFLGGGSSPIPMVLDPWFFQHFVFGPLYTMIGPHASPMVMTVLGSLLNPVTVSMWFWAIVKVYSLVIFAILVRGTLPRFRIDQLMDFGWKRLIPLSLVLFLAVAFLMEIISRG